MTPVSYSIVSEDEYNAGAQSSYTTVAEKPYQVTYVNARINELTPTGTDSSEADATEGFISLGLGVDPSIRAGRLLAVTMPSTTVNFPI